MAVTDQVRGALSEAKDLGECITTVLRGACAHAAGLDFEFCRRRFEQRLGQMKQLSPRILGCCLDRPAKRERDAAAGLHGRIGQFGVARAHADRVVWHAQHLCGDHSQHRARTNADVAHAAQHGQ